MIEDLTVSSLGVVAEASIRPAAGLTAITGETGTGKTMVLTSLGLMLGRRADPALVRTGADRAVVEGTVLLDPDSPAGRRAVEAGAEFDDAALFITRTVPAQGRSRAHLGGRAVPSSVLADVLGESVTIHGQSDQLRLKSPDAQRSALDSAAGPEHADALRAYGAAWEDLRAARAAARSFRDDTVARRAEVAALRDVVSRWDSAEPGEGEDAALREEAARLGNVEELRLAAARAHAALSAEDDGSGAAGAATAVERARAALEGGGRVDPTLARLASRVAEIGYQVDDVATELASYLASLDGDPVRLDQIHTRIAQLTELTRGYEGLADMAERVAEARTRLEQLTGPGADGEAVQARLDEAAAAVRETGAAVTAGRHRAAEHLATAIDAELAGLSMPGAHLDIALVERERPVAHGLEDVEFRLRPHPGAPARPLGQGASGGELSRVMLALELVLARAQHRGAAAEPRGDGPHGDEARPTMVFDEIDAGIGGRTATQIGRRLAALSRHVQVIVVTHLAQVAAFADTQIVVAKSTKGATTLTTVTEVEGAQREEELARMLSGHDTRTARQHAAELIEAARVGD